MNGYQKLGLKFSGSLIVIKLIVVQVIAVLSAERVESKESKREPFLEREIMLVALGPIPPRRYNEKNKRGDSAMLLPREDEVPPNRLYYPCKGRDPNMEEEWVALQLAFNNMGVMHRIEADKDMVLHRKTSGGYEPYVMVPAGAAGISSIVFLTPKPPEQNTRKLWLDKPHVTTISPSLPSLKGKQVIIANFSKLNVLHAFDDKVTHVNPGQIIAYHRKQAGVLYHLAARYGSEKKIIYNMAIRLELDAGPHLFALYDAMPATNAGRSVGVFRLIMPAP